ncbi:hypothetical protein AGMMS49574_07170 [Bacteroidia bacterium]|nr:hypothetical protein AGMMS49574_07170 [Bacteroidia bacterium]
MQVVIHWDGMDAMKKSVQGGMAVHLFRWENNGKDLQATLPVNGGRMSMPEEIPFFTLCYDYYGNDYINFRHEHERELFEAYSVPANGVYNTYGPGVESSEPTVAEPYPYHFFVTRNEEPFRVEAPAVDTVQYLHFYPKDVLHEFTFLIADVEGAKNIAGAHGAVTGMSSTYRMEDGAKGSAPSTVLFGSEAGRVQWKVNARQMEWTQQMLDKVYNGEALLADWPDDWSNPETGWTGDWVMGTFCTFGPADAENIRNRLTVETVSTGKGYFHGTWGGSLDDTVRRQIAGALGKNGTREEQLAWRRQNGGFDIVLYNNGRLVVPDVVPPREDGGITVDLEGFDNMDIPLSTKK